MQSGKMLDVPHFLQEPAQLNSMTVWTLALKLCSDGMNEKQAYTHDLSITYYLIVVFHVLVQWCLNDLEHLRSLCLQLFSRKALGYKTR